MTKRTYLFSALAGCLITSPTVADEPPFYFEAKVGSMDADFSGFDPAFNVGVVVGYDLNFGQTGTLSAEGEYTATLSDGDIDRGGEWDANTFAVYGVYRMAGNLYGKAKAGFLDQDIKRAGGTAPALVNADESGFSFGIGAGWLTGRDSRIEAEYAVLSDELSFISLGYAIHY